jgi:pyruvate kinase
MIGADSVIARAIGVSKRLGICDAGDIVVATGGATEGKSGTTNTLKVLTVSN